MDNRYPKMFSREDDSSVLIIESPAAAHWITFLPDGSAQSVNSVYGVWDVTNEVETVTENQSQESDWWTETTDEKLLMRCMGALRLVRG